MSLLVLVCVAACASDDADVQEAARAREVVPNLGGSGGAATQAIFYDDPALRCYKLRAYASTLDKTQKYRVPTGADSLVAFNLRAQWSGTQYIRSFRGLVDNAEVVHRWLLFRQLSGTREGVTPNVRGTHPDGELLHGGSPSGDDLWLDRDVGMEVPAGSLLQLEVHYDNRTGAPALDASGVEVCVTPTRPAHLAGLARLGTDGIAGTSARGTCTPAGASTIRLIAARPCMQQKGAHMRVDLRRARGASEVVHDQPFALDVQRTALFALDIEPGDRLVTTCSYRAPARFGGGVDDELCYFFAVYWPHGALTRSSFASLIHGPSTCID